MGNVTLMDEKKREKANYSNYSLRESFDIDDIKSVVKDTEEEVKIMGEYLRKGEFEQYEKRIDEKFANLNSKIDDLPERIDKNIQLRISEMKDTQMKWFIATLIALAGLAGRIFGLY